MNERDLVIDEPARELLAVVVTADRPHALGQGFAQHEKNSDFRGPERARRLAPRLFPRPPDIEEKMVVSLGEIRER